MPEIREPESSTRHSPAVLIKGSIDATATKSRHLGCHANLSFWLIPFSGRASSRYWIRAVIFVAHGIIVKAVLTDNGSCYH